MKKLLFVLLAVLLLSGCTGKNGTETEGTTEPTTEPVYTGTYEKNSAVERETGGAVRQFRPGGRHYTGITAMGTQLLLLSDGETSGLELLTGPECASAAVAELPLELSQAPWQVTETGFFCYDRAARQILCLDSSLVETQRVSLPEDMTGEPLLSANGTEVLYCRGQELRALDIRQGIDRLIRSHSCTEQSLLGSYFSGTVVYCRLTQEDGTGTDVMLSAENGSVLWEDPGIVEMTTAGDRYYTYRMDGVTPQYLCGTKGAEVWQLSIPQHTVPALEMGLLVGISTEEQNTVLTCYSADTGRKTAEVTLRGMEQPLDIWADSRNQCLWLLMQDGVLLCWKPADSAVTGEANFAGPVYTREAPDTQALDILQERVDQLNSQHGVKLRIWQEAVKTPVTHTLEPEYQSAAISDCLDTLEGLLNRFPEGFLKKCVSSGIRICIVRSVDGTAETLHYWDGTDAFIAVSCGASVETGFLQALGYIVDVHILGNSPLADTWGELNPTGFSYGQTGEPGDAFPDGEAMVSVTDDRAHVFFYAMLPENEELFASKTLQKKLLTLCKAIRDAWGWERKSDVYPWEQYLEAPIAYKK